MASQLTVRLPDDMKKELNTLARKLNRSPSEIVRVALREFLMSQPGSDIRPADRARSLIGSLESGVPDLAERHREVILESLRNAR
jgi:metal-responsive CopG/Arc/MetJ family transcriptional regulator